MASIYACQKFGCHIVAMEEDATIFMDVLQPPIVDPISEVLKRQQLDDQEYGDDSDNEELLLILDIVP